ncbi:hypothetical protein [Marinomonas profundimaris]|uniref:Uncharacterized protein n=1 Tax=Marinomonas profundimaris TaxID=1208321 RepID=W1S187_9GAMM|nr:hypothetical protein [Marinomonas profundimaris]ETI60838.1 hypothetical protein D104_08165 [Marinomonas profundimaris]
MDKPDIDSVQDFNMERVNLDMTTSDEIKRQIHHMSFGIDALDGLGMMAAHAVDDDIGVTGEQIGSLLKYEFGVRSKTSLSGVLRYTFPSSPQCNQVDM